MIFFTIVIAAMCLAGCGMQGIAPFDSLISMQPRVIAVAPAEGEKVAPTESVAVEFSRSIDPITVNESTLAIIKTDATDEGVEGVADDVEDGDLIGAHGIYEFQQESRTALFHANEPFEKGATYVIVATSKILSPDLIPLNQNPGSTPTPFTSFFRIVGEGQDADGSISGEEGQDESDIVRIRPSHLLINEILYDAVGSDTDGDVFVELFGEAGGDITGYKLVFINGEDGIIKDTIEVPADSLIGDDGLFIIADAKTGSPDTSDVEAADYIKNFDPQNGPDCMQLLNEKEELIDAIAYGEPIVDLGENGLSCKEGFSAMDVSSGQSLSRVDGMDTDDNVSDFKILDSPTPGFK